MVPEALRWHVGYCAAIYGVLHEGRADTADSKINHLDEKVLAIGVLKEDILQFNVAMDHAM